MSKTPRKTRSESEHQRGVIRELTKENRALKKQLKHLEKKQHIFDLDEQPENPIFVQDTDVDHDTEDTHKLPARFKCSDEDGCGKGYMEEYHILDRIIGTCNICGNRKRLK